MKLLSTLLASLIFVLCIGTTSSTAAIESEALEENIREMFESYINVYNRRFQSRTGDAEFREEIVQYLHTPLVMFPATSPPQVVETSAKAAANFAGFTNMLISKGVKNLEWQDLQIRVLSPNKAIANNVGHGTDAEGRLVYETVSVYLVLKSDAGWVIQTLNPYLIDQRFSLAGP